jgi:hypothetical protein
LMPREFVSFNDSKLKPIFICEFIAFASKLSSFVYLI